MGRVPAASTIPPVAQKAVAESGNLSENTTVGRAIGPSEAKDGPAGGSTIAQSRPNQDFRNGPTASPGVPAGKGDALGRERLILFLPAAPLVVELRMTIDGKPFGAAREELVDDALQLADRDGDGRATWEEIYSDPKRVFAERFDVQTRNVLRKEFFKTYDINQNSLLDREEARRLVSRAKSAGDAFTLGGSAEYRHSNRRQSIVRAMLDANGDDVLDAAELTNTPERLRARDANNDHLVSWDELDDSLAGDQQAMAARQDAYFNRPAALRLGTRASWDGILYALAELYLSNEEIPQDAPPLFKSLADRLDADHDAHLSYEEAHSLDAVEPQLILAANFGRTGDLLTGVSLVSTADILGPRGDFVSHLPNGLLLRLTDYRLQVLIDDRQGEDAKTAAEAQLQAQATAIHAIAQDDQDVLFALLDANRDGRLTKRELQAAAEVLLALDADGDGRISLEELPGSMTLWLGRGMPMGMSPTTRMIVAPPPAPTGPDWFVSMDENRDQEISLDEFPGTAEKFHALDLNGDDFISLSEAFGAVD